MTKDALIANLRETIEAFQRLVDKQEQIIDKQAKLIDSLKTTVSVLSQELNDRVVYSRCT